MQKRIFYKVLLYHSSIYRNKRSWYNKTAVRHYGGHGNHDHARKPDGLCDNGTAEFLIQKGVSYLYACGTDDEMFHLTTAERMGLAGQDGGRPGDCIHALRCHDTEEP